MDLNIKLDKSFTTEFNRLKEKYGNKMLELNGFADFQLNYTDFIDNFVDKDTTADVSIDGNANVNHKDVVTLLNEMNKPHLKLLSFNKIFYELNKKYGHKVATDWLEHEWNGSFYLHDANTSSYIGYCFAYDIDKLVTDGLYFIDNFNAQPPKHLTTFTDFVGEFISWNCNRTSGAVATPSFLVYSYYFWKKDCEDGYVIKSPEYYRDQEFQRIIYKLNQPYLRGGIQSAFTNFSIFDESYFEALFGGKTFPDGSYMIDIMEDFMEYQKAFMRVVSKIRQQNMMTFPVLTFSLLRKDDKFVNEDFAKWCCEHNLKYADSNFFISDDITSLSACCRLKANVENLGYFNSLGGSALEVGSIKVNTINLARIAYETDSQENYLKKLKDTVNLNLKALDRIRYIIQRNVEKGLLPNYALGVINMKNQYNTIGIIGIYETLQKFGLTYKDELGYAFYTEEGMKFAEEILQVITDTKNEFGKNVDYMINIEQVPAERCAAILMEKDKLLFPNQIYELPLYGNQWIPLGVKTTLEEKVRISAILDKACSGGSIAHLNLDKPLEDFDTAWKLLNYVANAGVTYFAFNLRINACKHNHGFYGNTCPTCGEPVETSYQRIN